MNKITDDIAILTNISEKLLKKLVNIIIKCISHAVYESICKDKTETAIDVGFGELHLYVNNKTIRYKFIPSEELEEELIKTATSKISPIAIQLDTSLKEKIEKTYKELL